MRVERRCPLHAPPKTFKGAAPPPAGMFPCQEVLPAVVSALLCKGSTVPEIEARTGRSYKGAPRQGRHRNKRVWHDKKSVDRRVAARLKLDPSVLDPDRTTNDLQDATAKAINKLRRDGKLVDWSGAKGSNTYRLAEGHGLKRKAPRMGLGERAAAGTAESRWLRGQYTDADRTEMFMRILDRAAKDNTYKFALARALLEMCRERHDGGGQGPYTIEYEELARRFLRYYWHQECVFRIRQDRHPGRKVAVIRAIRDNMDWDERDTPASFDALDDGYVERAVRDIRRDVFGNVRGKKTNVVPRFQKIKIGECAQEIPMFYTFDGARGTLTVRAAACRFLAANYSVLLDAVTLRWARYLEGANGGLPGLIAKIEAARTLPRRNAAFIRSAADAIYKMEQQCFYCHCRLKRADIEMDHVIPWSFLFDDQLWNLVPACGGCNGRKSNSLPDLRTYNLLKARNMSKAGSIDRLAESLEELGRGGDWRREMRSHYDTCRRHGFAVMTGGQIRRGPKRGGDPCAGRGR